MGLLQDFVKICLSTPPNNIDFDNFDSQTAHAHDTLIRVAQIIDDDFHPSSPMSLALVETLDRYWSSVWTWIAALARGMQHKHFPSTELGRQRTEMFVGFGTDLLLYPVGNPLRDTEAKRKKLEALVESTPMIVTALIGIWQHACEIGLNEVPTSKLLDSISVFLILLNMENEIHERGLPSRALEELGTSMEARRWDVSRVNMKGIIHELSLASPDFTVIRDHLLVTNILVASLGTRGNHTPTREAVRWVCTVMKKLALRRYNPFDPQKQSKDVKITCLVECLLYITHSLATDVYLGISALDAGLLLHICKLKDLMNGHWKIYSPLDTKDSKVVPAIQTAVLLRALTRYLIHQPILVRVVRWMKKIKRLGLDDWDGIEDPQDAGIAETLKVHWAALEDEALRRESVEWTTPAQIICGNENCTNTRIHDKFTFSRCSGCRHAVYCSKSCQKKDWKASHKTLCQTMQSDIRLSKYVRLPGALDMKLLQIQFLNDFTVKELFRATVTTLVEKAVMERGIEPVIWADYATPPTPMMELLALTPMGSEIYLAKLGGNIMRGPGDTPDARGGVLLYAMIPFRTNGPLLFSYRDLTLQFSEATGLPDVSSESEASSGQNSAGQKHPASQNHPTSQKHVGQTIQAGQTLRASQKL
ncbi:hypothetical protein PM082_021327 [Marasmius tenuissimus]|nr:hypothetical protein PM082_021327 [Marasmius tenuissimus]